jgi:hypothetical protein
MSFTALIAEFLVGVGLGEVLVTEPLAAVVVEPLAAVVLAEVVEEGAVCALDALSLNAAAVCVAEGLTANTAPWLHKPPASSKNQIGSVLFIVTLMMGRPAASTARLSAT